VSESERLLRKYGYPVILPLAETAGIVDELAERERSESETLSREQRDSKVDDCY
jgi:hypothetical protein